MSRGGRPSRSLLAPIVLGALATARTASSAPPPGDPAAAEALFEQGRAAAARQDWAGACAAFEKSEAMDPAAGTLLNLGDCSAHLGKVASAWQDFVEALRELPPDDDRRAYTTARIADLEKRVPRLIVVMRGAAPPGTTVTRNGISMPPETLGQGLPIDPGKVTLVVQAPGRAPATFSRDVREGETDRVEVEPGPPVAGAEVREPGPTTSVRPRGTGPWRSVGFVGIAVGAAGLATGTVTGILALSRASDYANACGPSHACPDAPSLARAQGDSRDAKTFGAISTATLIGGGAVFAAGLLLVFTHPSSSSEGSQTAAGIVPAPGGAVAVWRGTF